MLISLNRACFEQDPDERFAKKRKVPVGLLREIYRRNHLLDYTLGDIQDYYELKTHKVIDRKNMWLWVLRLEIYYRAQEAIKKGAKQVNLEYFGDNRSFVAKHILQVKEKDNA